MKTPRQPAPFEIKPRRPNFDLNQSIPKHWNDNDPVKSHFPNSLSVILPAYEQFFIQALQKSKNIVSDPELKKEIQGFCAQEGTHAAEHRKYNAMLLKQGYTAVPVFEKASFRFLNFVQKKLSVSMLLAIAAAGEHMTTFMGHDYLVNPEKWSQNTDPTMNALWEWHAAEELEHKNVCFDAYQEVSGRWFQRIFAMVIANAVSLAWVAVIYFYFLSADKVLLRFETWKGYYHLMLGKRGFLKMLFSESLNYGTRDFHPGNLDDTKLIQAWRSRNDSLTALGFVR